MQEKKEEIWLSPMTKAPTPTEKSKKQRDNIRNATKTSITQRLRTGLEKGTGRGVIGKTFLSYPLHEVWEADIPTDSAKQHDPPSSDGA